MFQRKPKVPTGWLQHDTTVRNGFPVIAVFKMAPAEPDVGIFNDYVDDVYILSSKGKEVPFIDKKMTQDDWSNLCIDIQENYSFEREE